MSLQLQPQPKPLDWPSVLEHLREVLPRWQHRHQSPILQLCIPIAEPDPLEWLQHQEGATRVYWSDREHQFQLAGLGSTLQIRGTTDEVMQKGTIDHAAFDPREVIRRALDLGAASVIMVHNHPGGTLQPSDEDVAMTREVAAALTAVGIDLHDDVVVGRAGYASFKAMGLL